MQGKLMDLAENPKVARITPAYAGKTTGAAERRLGVKDYPRLRGENEILKHIK